MQRYTIKWFVSRQVNALETNKLTEFRGHKLEAVKDILDGLKTIQDVSCNGRLVSLWTEENAVRKMIVVSSDRHFIVKMIDD